MMLIQGIQTSQSCQIHKIYAILPSFSRYHYMEVKMGSRISETAIFGPSKSIYSYPKDNLKTKHSHTMTKHHPSVLINVF